MNNKDMFFLGMIVFGIGGFVLISYLITRGFFGELGGFIGVAYFMLFVFVVIKKRRLLR